MSAEPVKILKDVITQEVAEKVKKKYFLISGIISV